MNLRFKILIGFLIVISIFFIVVLYNFFFLSRIRNKTHTLVNKKFLTEKYIQESNLIVMQMYSDVWDSMLFNINDDSVDVEKLIYNYENFYQNLKLLKENIPGRINELDYILSLYMSYYDIGYEILKINSLDEFKRKQYEIEIFRKNRMELIVKLDRIVSSTSMEFEQSLRSLKKNFQISAVVIVLFTFITIIIAVILSLLIATTLTKPISNLMLIIREVENDNYDVQVKIITRDEVGKLSHSLNRMIRQVNLSRQKLKEQERLKREMEIAEKIQTSLCPVPPFHPDLEIAALMKTAEEVGGDYYDFIMDDQNIWFAIGDVSGHGVTPGLIMMMAQTAIYSHIMKYSSLTPKDTLIEVNKILYDNVKNRLNESHFMTLNLLKYTGQGKFIHAGAHVDIIILREKTKKCEKIITDGIFMAIIPDANTVMVDNEFVLDHGDIMFLYTDGIIEAKNKDNKLLDIDGLIEIIERNSGENVSSFLNLILNQAMHWCNNAAADDMTLVVAKRR